MRIVIPWRGRAARQAAWLTLPFFVQQGFRLVTNVVIARLLAPEMFGVMVLINTLRTGVELLSDIGIGQSIVRSPHAHDREFLDTAWTIQFVRGAALTALALCAAEPIARAYGKPELVPIIAAVSLTFLFMGLQSPSIFVMQRDVRVQQRAFYDIADVIFASALSITLAYFWGNIWALVWSLVLSFAMASTLTYIFDRQLPRFRWQRQHVHEIFHFGKWVFLSTAIYFAAMSTDRLYFSAAIPLAVVGVYGVARTFADLGVALAQRIGAFLVFPKVVELRQASGDSRILVRESFRRNRLLALTGIALALAAGLAVSDELILLLYDQRYHGAAFMLPVLLVGVWFAILSVFGESTLLGLDRPRTAAAGNAVKFGVLIVGLPIVVPWLGMFAGLSILTLAEISRWLTLALLQHRERLAPLRDDLGLTALIGVAAVALKMGLSALGLVPSLSQWWELGADAFHTIH